MAIVVYASIIDGFLVFLGLNNTYIDVNTNIVAITNGKAYINPIAIALKVCLDIGALHLDKEGVEHHIILYFA